MNTSFNMAKMENPMEGEMYYDISLGQMKMYADGEWHSIVNTDTETQNFKWLTGTKIKVLKILNNVWLLEHITVIKQWLADTDYGEYCPEITSILFNNDAGATAFMLKFA